MTAALSPFATPIERLATYFEPTKPRVQFQDSEVDEIAHLLQQCSHTAARCPRTYILFRTIGHLEVIERLVGEGFTDAWFPVEHRGLPSFLAPNIRSAVVQYQKIILTKSLDLENGRHRHFAPGEQLPFDILGRLGSGGHGQVDRISSKLSFRQYALKRVRRKVAFGNASSREALNAFLREMRIMRSLTHKHMVQYIGSYSDRRYLGLIMSPVADSDLASYLERLSSSLKAHHAGEALTPTLLQAQSTVHEMIVNLRTFFGCLASALTYLHSQNVRHKDIKPQNILVLRGDVMLTDFGLSHDFTDDTGSTSSGMTLATPRYCAPEVAAYEPRNTSSDIWSLGCVFLEMVSALQGIGVDSIRLFFATGSTTGLHYHNNPAATKRLIEKLKLKVARPDQRPLLWIADMLLVDRNKRPTAAHVLEMITTPETEDDRPSAFCGICCVPDLVTDSSDSLEEDVDIVPTIALENYRAMPVDRQQTEEYGHSKYESGLSSEDNKALDVEELQSSTPGSSQTVRPENETASVLRQTPTAAASSPVWKTSGSDTQTLRRDGPGQDKKGESDTLILSVNQVQPNSFSDKGEAQPDRLQEVTQKRQHQQTGIVSGMRGNTNTEPALSRQSEHPRTTAPKDRRNVTTTAASKKKDPLAVGTLEKDVLEAFKHFSRAEKLRMVERRRLIAREEEAAKLDGLKNFASNFKLRTPIPIDLLPILAKDETKQAALVVKAFEQADDLYKPQAFASFSKPQQESIIAPKNPSYGSSGYVDD